MRPSLKIYFFCLLVSLTYAPSQAQDTIITFSSDDITAEGYLKLYKKNNWYFRSGNDSSWANTTIDMGGWIALSPKDIDASYADANGKIEGWFRCTFKVDSSLVNLPWRLIYWSFAAGEVYLDGQLFGQYGDTGNNSQPFHFFLEADTTRRIAFTPGQIHTLAVHVKDEIVSPSSKTGMMIGREGGWAKTGFISVFQDKSLYNLLGLKSTATVYYSQWIGINVLFSFLFLLLFLFNRQERNLLWFAGVCLNLGCYTGLIILFNIAGYVVMHPQTLLYVSAASYIANFILALLLSISILKVFDIELRGFNRLLFIVLVLLHAVELVPRLINVYSLQNETLLSITVQISVLASLGCTSYWIFISYKKAGTAQKIVAAGIVLLAAFVLTYALLSPDLAPMLPII